MGIEIDQLQREKKATMEAIPPTFHEQLIVHVLVKHVRLFHPVSGCDSCNCLHRCILSIGRCTERTHLSASHKSRHQKAHWNRQYERHSGGGGNRKKKISILESTDRESKRPDLPAEHPERPDIRKVRVNSIIDGLRSHPFHRNSIIGRLLIIV